MCEATTIMMTLGAASALAGQASAASAAEANNEALEDQRRAQDEEIRAQANNAAGDRVKAARAERARLRVSAGEAGVAGNSLDGLMFDSFLQQSGDLAIIGQNEFFAQRGSNDRFKAGLRSGPSAAESALKIGVAGYSGYQQGLQIQDVRKRVSTSE